jgi:hypothetical protein
MKLNLDVKLITFVSFIPYVFNNRYLLLYVSSGRNSVIFQNWIHVYNNFLITNS